MQVVPHGTKTEHKHIKTACKAEKEGTMVKATTTKTVFGEVLENSKIRTGTKCGICGEQIGDFEFVHTSTNHESSVYVHKACIRQRRYHEPFVTPNGVERPLFGNTKATKSGIYMTPEIEIDRYKFDTTDENLGGFLAQFGLYRERDGSVLDELKSFTATNLHGTKQYYRCLEQYVDMTASCCGHHINVSFDGYSDKAWYIRQKAKELFGMVQNTMRNNPEWTKKVFGRYFTYYADDNGEYSKWDYSWLNLDKDELFEVRLFHYVNPTQITWGYCLCKEWALILKRYINMEISVERAAKLINNEFIKSAEGRAKYQRPERNKEI